MFRRLPTLLATCLLLPALAPAARAATPGVFTFAGTATEGCFGCGATTGRFYGAFTGVVDGHVYDSAPLTMDWTAFNPPQSCLVTSIASGTMRVSDGTSTHSWSFNWTRSYYAAVVATMNTGEFASTFLVVSPVGDPCGAGPVTIDMHGAGHVL